MAGAQQPQSTSTPNKVKEARVAEKRSEDTSHLHLTPVATISAKSEVATGFADLTCDEDANLYLGLEDTGATAIRKLDSAGELKATFKPYANPDVQVYGVGSYTVSPDGELYIWVGNKKDGKFYVLVFASDGSYKTSIKLDPGFPWVPGPFAVFRNGNLMMTGQEYAPDVRQPMLPFTAIFRPDGKLLKDLNLEDDVRIHDMAKARDPRITSAAVPNNNRAVAWGQVQPAKDGNIYIMRWLSPTVFYVVSPGGEVVRRFTVDPGASGLMPVSMHIAGNRIAVLFKGADPDEKLMKIVDLNGDEIATYDDAPVDPKSKETPIGFAFACYALKPERFIFLAADDSHRIQIRTVEAR
jgi:hypothetical protein